MTDWRHWDAYLRFHSAALAVDDVDPVYPVMRHWCASEHWGLENRLRAVLLHVTYYSMGSTVAAAHLIDTGTPLHRLPLNLPTGTERRAHRDQRKLAAHLHAMRDVLDTYGTLTAWLTGGNEPVTFDSVAERVQAIHGNGRWASFKFAEMAQKVAGLPLSADTMAIVGSSGPAKGLRLLAPGATVSEELAAQLVTDLHAAGVPASPETVETTLCDFHSLANGRYYVGYDIDQMLAQIVAVQPRYPDASWPLIWQARAASFPHEYLGERHGWTRPDSTRSKAYRDYGRVVLR